MSETRCKKAGFSMRLSLTFAAVPALTLLAACTPPPAAVDTGGMYGGTGYGDPAAQTAYGAGYPAAPGTYPPVGAGVPTAPTPSGISSTELNSALFGANGAPVGTMPPAPAYPQPALPQTAPLPSNVPPAATLPVQNGTGMSDEQDFEAVKSRQSIESDKARIEANKAQYQQIAPTALPERPKATHTSILVDYALSVQNRKGEPVYSRMFPSDEASRKACLRYPTPEAAQEAFLNAGGPKRDMKRLDPDGDGFACDWDPAPLQARGN